jgi:tRNA(Ile)-lysidine synthase TilS/MesJ
LKKFNENIQKDIFRPFVQAINEYELVEPGDKIAVAISGGKDSLILAKLFQELRSTNKFHLNLFSYRWIRVFTSESRIT